MIEHRYFSVSFFLGRTVYSVFMNCIFVMMTNKLNYIELRMTR